MEYVYVIYDASETCVVGIFSSIESAINRFKKKGYDSGDVFIKKIPLNCLYKIDDRGDDIILL